MRIYEYNLFFGDGLGFMKEIIDRAMFRNFIEGVFANDMMTSHCFSCRPFRIYSTRPVFKEFEGETHIKLNIYIGDYSIYGGFIKKSSLNDEKEFDAFYHFMIDQICYAIDRNKEIFEQLNSEDVSNSMHRVIKLKNANRCLYDNISAEVDKIKKGNLSEKEMDRAFNSIINQAQLMGRNGCRIMRIRTNFHKRRHKKK